jgi:hypothetical protein
VNFGDFGALHLSVMVLYVQHGCECQRKKTTSAAWNNWPLLPRREPSRSFDPCFPEWKGRCARGHNLKGIWEALQTEGLQVSYHTFYMVVWRARRKRAAPSSRGKQTKPSEAKALWETEVKTVEERDPLANLKRLEEENKPDFHCRGMQNVKTMVHGTNASNEKNNR